MLESEEFKNASLKKMDAISDAVFLANFSKEKSVQGVPYFVLNLLWEEGMPPPMTPGWRSENGKCGVVLAKSLA